MRSLPCALFALAICAAGSARAERQLSVSLEDFVGEMRVFMPGEGSNGFVVPTTAERQTFGVALAAVAAFDVAKAEAALASLPGFEVVALADGGVEYLGISEKPPLSRGWGFFFFARQPERPGLVIEAPHPLADRESEMMAARAVRRLRPSAFLLAGAHRYADAGRASDVAHTSLSVFEVAHEKSCTGGAVALQIHGFNAADHPGYPELLLSSGTAVPGPDASNICDRASALGIGCTLFNGIDFIPLGAQTNVQGGWSRRTLGDGHFLHFETAQSIREDPARFDAIAQSIEEHWPAPRSCGCGSASSPLSLFPLAAVAGALVFKSRRLGGRT